MPTPDQPSATGPFPVGVLSLSAPAKINLALAVGPPEPAGSPKPGWHRIASWMVCVDLCDDLELRVISGPSRFSVSWADDAPRPTPIDWPIEKDLIFRAHALMEKAAGRSLPVEAVLRKRTPVGGGLGGGSSDAAAMLRGLNRLFALGLDRAALSAIASTLGSDIAFFIDDDVTCDVARPALVSGFGDIIERVPCPEEDIILVAPDFGCPTPDVYRAFDAMNPGPLREDAVRELIARAEETGEIPISELFNDLAPAARAVRPGLTRIISDALPGTQIPIHVTGSGSTLFVPFNVPDEPDAINRVADLIEQTCPGVVCVLSATLSGEALVDDDELAGEVDQHDSDENGVPG